MRQTDGEIYHVLGLDEWMLRKWLHNPKQFIDIKESQITKGIFHRTRTVSFAICMEIVKTPNSERNNEKEEWNRGIRFPDFRLY